MRRGASDLLTALAAGGTAAVAARAAYAALRRRPPAGARTWTRVNHRGDELTLLEGPALALAAVATELAAAAVSQRKAESSAGTGSAGSRSAGMGSAGMERVRGLSRPATARPGRAAAAAALSGAGALGFGILDDLAGSAKRKGLRGHLGALRHGEVTTGAVKLAGIGATGLAAGLTLGGGPADAVVNAGLIAGGANLLNLFDLRPGRAVKVAALSGALTAAGAAWSRPPAPGDRGAGLVTAGPVPGAPGRATGLVAVAVPLGAALALLPEDLGERAMLGDAGANALGAMLGAAAAASLPRKTRVAALAAVIALTVASEKVSFTKVIERTPPLRWLDMLGRRQGPAQAATGPATASAASQGTGQPLAERSVKPRRRPGRHRRTAADAAATAQPPAGQRTGETAGTGADQRGPGTVSGSWVSRVRSGALCYRFSFRVPARQDP